MALDGEVSDETERWLMRVSREYGTTIVTADTFHTVRPFAERCGLQLKIVDGGVEKRDFVASLGPGVVAIGNGANDVGMMELATLATAILGPEGLSTTLIDASDILVPDIDRALELLINPMRLVATLRL